MRAADFESDGLAIAHGPDSEPPWLDVDTFIPKAGLSGVDGDGYGACDVEIDEVVAGGGVGYVDWLVVDGDGEGSGAQLRWNGYWLNMRRGENHAGGREHSRQKHTRSTQEAKT